MEVRKAERDPKRSAKALSAMMVAFRERGAEAEAVAAAYLYALDDLPPWAVEEAISRFIRGQVQHRNHAFAPTSAELHIVARQVIDEEYAKEHRLSNLKSEERYLTKRVDIDRCTPEQKAEVDWRLKNVREQIAAMSQLLNFSDETGTA